MVSGNVKQAAGHQIKENKDLRSIEEVVEWRNQGEEECTGERKEEAKKVRSGSARESRITEVDSAV